MARVVYKTKLREFNAPTPSVRELKIDFVDPSFFKFQAGQFVMLHVPQPGEEKPALRAYSIASSDAETKSLTLLIKLLEKGVASDFVRTLKGGEELTFTGPFGKLFFRQPAPPKVNMFCTGAGLSQHMCYLLSLGERFPTTSFRMLISVWNEKEMFYQKELEALKTKLKDFQYEFILDKPLGAWNGLTGYVQDHMEKHIKAGVETDYYLCGHPQMIKTVRALLVEKHRQPEDRIFSEAFH